MFIKLLDDLSTALVGTTFAPHQWLGATIFLVGLVIFVWPE
ncbi:hypothetical protein [Novosphingobium sp. JCM 18896]|nr:hypothetical protein [Novosphingobium sp. JCM 18896]MCW1430830.1 hypothetical protein [Novosphingobium sp. JCM 18896]